MNPLVTITVNPDGTHRISRITAHGEDVIYPSREVAVVALALWTAVARDGFDGGWCVLAEDVREQLQRSGDAVIHPVAELERLRRESESLEDRVRFLERRQREIDATPPPPPPPPAAPRRPRGQ